MYWDLPPEGGNKEKEEEMEEVVEGVEEDKPLMGPEEPLETYSAVTPEQLEAFTIPNGNTAPASPSPSIEDTDLFQKLSVRNGEHIYLLHLHLEISENFRNVGETGA